MKKTILSVVAIATLTTGAFADVCKDGAKGDYVGNIVCNNLETTDMFKGLTSVKGDLILTGSFKNVDGLSDLKAIYSKKEVGSSGFFSTSTNDWEGESKFALYSGEMENVDGLKNLKTLQGDLIINESYGITSEEAKKNFTGNKVRNFDSLEGLTKARRIFIPGNLDTNGLYGFRNLRGVCSINIARDLYREKQPINKKLYMAPLSDIDATTGINIAETHKSRYTENGIYIGDEPYSIDRWANGIGDWSGWNFETVYCKTAYIVVGNVFDFSKGSVMPIPYACRNKSPFL